MPAFFNNLFPASFIVLWLIISWLISLSGWNELAKWYRASSGPAATSNNAIFRFQSGSLSRIDSLFRDANYKGVLWVECSPDGLRLSVALPFRFRHPPLLLPWSALGPVQTKPAFLGLGRIYLICITLPGSSRRIELSIYNNQELAYTITHHWKIANSGSEDYATS